MSENYRYDGKDLSEIVAMEILQHQFGEFRWLGADIGTITTEIYDFHRERGGKIIGRDNEWSENIKRALNNLSYFGRASKQKPNSNYWYIPKPKQRILGEGKHWVYCYYVETQKESSIRYPCTIGFTRDHNFKGVRKYIEKQTSKAITETPKIPLLFRTESPVELEGAIHRTLKLRGNHIRGEIFNTTPIEVREIYDFIIHQNASYTYTIEGMILDYVRSGKDPEDIFLF